MNTGSSSPPNQWRGKPVPQLLAMWFDQLVADSALIDIANHRYIDVTLTCGSAGVFAKPPQILLK